MGRIIVSGSSLGKPMMHGQEFHLGEPRKIGHEIAACRSREQPSGDGPGVQSAPSVWDQCLTSVVSASGSPWVSLTIFEALAVTRPAQNRFVMLEGRHDRDDDDVSDCSVGAGRGWHKLHGYLGGLGSCLADRTRGSRCKPNPPIDFKDVGIVLWSTRIV